MVDPKHNRPNVTVEMPHDIAEFLEENCGVNMSQGLSTLNALNGLPTTSRESLEKLVDLVEKFKEARDHLKKALTQPTEKDL